MTTETNSVLNTVKEAFAPVTEAFTKLQNMEVPEAAREFVKKQAETAKERAAEAYWHGAVRQLIIAEPDVLN